MRRSQAANRLLLTLLAVFFLGCRPSETPVYRFVQTWGQRGDEPGQLREPIGIAVPAGDPLLLNLVENYLAAIKAAGALEKLNEKWFKSGAWLMQLP